MRHPARQRCDPQPRWWERGDTDTWDWGGGVWTNTQFPFGRGAKYKDSIFCIWIWIAAVDDVIVIVIVIAAASWHGRYSNRALPRRGNMFKLGYFCVGDCVWDDQLTEAQDVSIVVGLGLFRVFGCFVRPAPSVCVAAGGVDGAVGC